MYPKQLFFWHFSSQFLVHKLWSAFRDFFGWSFDLRMCVLKRVLHTKKDNFNQILEFLIPPLLLLPCDGITKWLFSRPFFLTTRLSVLLHIRSHNGRNHYKLQQNKYAPLSQKQNVSLKAICIFALFWSRVNSDFNSR